MKLLTRAERTEEEKRREAEAQKRPSHQTPTAAEVAARLQAEANAKHEASEKLARELEGEKAFLEATGERVREVNGERYHWSPYASDTTSLTVGLCLVRMDSGLAICCDLPAVNDKLRELFPLVDFGPIKSVSQVGWPRVTPAMLSEARSEKWRRGLAQFPEEQHARIIACTGMAEVVADLRPLVTRIDADREKAAAKDAEGARREREKTRKHVRAPALRGEPVEWLRAWHNGERILAATQDRLERDGYLRRRNENLELTSRGEQLLAEAT